MVFIRQWDVPILVKHILTVCCCHFREGLSEWVMKHQGAPFQYWGGRGEQQNWNSHLLNYPRFFCLMRRNIFAKDGFGAKAAIWKMELRGDARSWGARGGEKKTPTEVTPIARRHWYLSDGTNWICLPSAACWSSKQRISGSTYQSCQSKSVWLRTWETQTSRGVGAHEAR